MAVLDRALWARRDLAHFEAETSLPVRELLFRRPGAFSFAFALQNELSVLVIEALERKKVDWTTGEVFRLAVLAGRLKVAARLADKFRLRKGSILKRRVQVKIGDATRDCWSWVGFASCSTFEIACRNGDGEAVKWLVERFGIKPKELRESRSFSLALQSGNFGLFEWLVTFARPPPQFVAEKVLCSASRVVTAETLSWVVDCCGITREALFCPIYLRKICTEERLDLVRWLEWRFGLRKEEMVETGALTVAFWGANVALIRYFAEAFGLATDDMREEVERSRKRSAASKILPLI